MGGLLVLERTAAPRRAGPGGTAAPRRACPGGPLLLGVRVRPDIAEGGPLLLRHRLYHRGNYNIQKNSFSAHQNTFAVPFLRVKGGLL